WPRRSVALSRCCKAGRLRRGCSSCLKTDGHQLILGVVTEVLDLEVDREIVFHCNIYDLDFEGDGKLDPLCEEARKAVLNA
uniref:Uncharacterized protein n=1 Tax=Cyanistes caeruleus TaxID=156563 RepID=A0A8C0VED4_CYACU